MSLRTWVKDQDQILASSGQVLYMYAPGTATDVNRRRMVDAIESFASSSEGKFGFLMHLTQHSKPPPASERKDLKEMFRRLGPRLSGVAVVVEADGFAGSVLRSAVTMLFVTNRGGFPAKVFAHPAEAAAWLSARQQLKAAALETLVREGQEEFRAA